MCDKHPRGLLLLMHETNLQSLRRDGALLCQIPHTDLRLTSRVAISAWEFTADLQLPIVLAVGFVQGLSSSSQSEFCLGRAMPRLPRTALRD